MFLGRGMYSFLLNILTGVKGEYISLIIFNVFMGLLYGMWE